MKKFEGILICTDLDGTLVSRGVISKENLDAIEYFKSEGGAFTFITGRVPTTSTHLAATIKPNVPVGCINGGGLYDFSQNKYLWHAELSRKALDVLEYIDKNTENIGFQVNTPDKIYFCREDPVMQSFRRGTGVPDLRKHYRDIDEILVKIVFGSVRGESIPKIRQLFEEHPFSSEFDFVRSEEPLCEILPKGTNKGLGLLKLTEILGIDPRRTVAIGDYDNDIAMIKTAGVGIAVANASPAAKEAADIITVSNHEHAIARIISEIESGAITV